MFETLGFFNPEIKDEIAYQTLLLKMRKSKSWIYSSPNRIEPKEDGKIDLVELRDILKSVPLTSDDFFRGSISVWGTYLGNPKHSAVIYITKEFEVKYLILNE